MKRNQGIWLAVGGGLGLLSLALVASWVVTAMREEARQTREAISEAKKSIPLSGLGEQLNETLSQGLDLTGRILGGAGEVSKQPHDLLGEVVQAGQQLSKGVDQLGQDLFRMTPEEVKLLGRQVHEGVVGQSQVVETPSGLARLQRLAAPYLESRDASGEFTFLVIDDPQVNAFAHIGGYIYVTTGLLEFAKSDAELQFVLGHEIGHVKLGHCTAQMTYAAQAAKLTGDWGAQLAQLSYHVIALGYSEDKEYGADEFAVRQFPRSREGGLEFLTRLQGIYPDQHPPEHESHTGLPSSAELLQELDNHFRSHPPTNARVQRLRSLK